MKQLTARPSKWGLALAASIFLAAGIASAVIATKHYDVVGMTVSLTVAMMFFGGVALCVWVKDVRWEETTGFEPIAYIIPGIVFGAFGVEILFFLGTGHFESSDGAVFGFTFGSILVLMALLCFFLAYLFQRSSCVTSSSS